jgi:hypothetical protein
MCMSIYFHSNYAVLASPNLGDFVYKKLLPENGSHVHVNLFPFELPITLLTSLSKFGRFWFACGSCASLNYTSR